MEFKKQSASVQEQERAPTAMHSITQSGRASGADNAFSVSASETGELQLYCERHGLRRLRLL